jgi:hypothetical protein
MTAQTMHELLEMIARRPFSLQAAAEFGFGPNAGRPPAYQGLMRFAFPLDGVPRGRGVSVKPQKRVPRVAASGARLQGPC